MNCSADNILKYFNIFHRKQDVTFHANRDNLYGMPSTVFSGSNGDNLHEMSNHIVLEK